MRTSVHTGGISGVSEAIIRNSYAKCILYGNSYVGGIAGYGYEIDQCVSLVSVKDSTGYIGAIAGDWDRENGTLAGNRFVSRNLAGVDGVSYAEKAEPVAYETLVAEPDIPDAFRTMNVTYMAEGEIVHTTAYAYGEPLTEKTIPEPPEKDGYYGVWEDVGEDTVTCDHMLDAVYTPYTTTLVSDSMRDDIHPVFLIEGIFKEGASLSAELEEETDGKERWKVTLSNAPEPKGSHTVRFTLPKEWKECKLYLVTEDGKKSELQTESEGSCRVFSVDDSTFTLEAQRSVTEFFGAGWILAVAAVIILIVIFFVLTKKKRKKQPKREQVRHQLENGENEHE